MEVSFEVCLYAPTLAICHFDTSDFFAAWRRRGWREFGEVSDAVGLDVASCCNTREGHRRRPLLRDSWCLN